MKLSIYTFIALLIALMVAPASAEKKEGEVKRYSMTLERKKPSAESTNNEEAKQLIEKAAVNASEKSDTEHEQAQDKPKEASRKWWKPWGKEDAERKEAGKGSGIGQRKREENSRKWWKLWGENELDAKDRNKPPAAAKKQTQDKGKTWWKPWQ